MTAIIPTLWSSDNSVPLNVEDAVLAIRNSRRRHVIMLVEDQQEMSVSDLAEAIAAIELDKEIFEVCSKERSRAYIALIQVHLPTLDDAGAVAYHERSKHVYETDATSGLAKLVRHFESVCETG